MDGFQKEVRMYPRTPDEVAREAEAARARESGLLYAGAEGLDTLKAHMRTLYRERKEGTGEGYGHEFFRGMLHGLALADAMDAQVSVGIHDFIKVWGYITD
ncbi:hypothetical protein [Cupriavidus basilensis]|uniref:Uncharacterized protein n=1 Tax=Cupriavidus basilensis TaxID=68895 RepID=A0A643FVP9_9BURK|nr:hypothetical protein [Cupriavidus basilensis]QOT82208.1 hypothetical protein F7R26_039545 [Cupriavidus basilensis]